jgi:two-component system, cell cycle sensor histidine kinase and response regulator CckA
VSFALPFLLLLVAFAVVTVLLVRERAAARAASSATPPTAGEEWPGAEERFRTPLEQVENYAIILLDTAGRPTSWNPGIRRVLGYEKAEFLQTTAADLYPQDARERGAPAADLAESARRGRFTIERALVRKDGSRFWGSVSTTAVRDREGRLLGFGRRLRDATERRETEEELSRNREALEAALEAAGLGTWEYDHATGLDSMDRRARMLFGLEGDEPVTMARWLEAIHPDDRKRTLERWQRAIRECAPYSAEYRVVWPDGSVHWLTSVGRCLTDPATGSPLQFTGVVLDLTQRRRTEEHLQESLRLEAVGRLAGGIAHDLNNMLAAILGFADLLVGSFEPDDPRASDVQQISLAANRSAGLTRQLLAFARREMIQPRPLDINTVVRHAQPLLPPLLGENVELELRLAPEPGVVNADARQIEQIVMNLVLNARDAMPQGGRVTIETGAVDVGAGAEAWRGDDERAPSGRFTMLSVTDTGHGMDAAVLQRIWEPFFTTKPAGRGTGLGLSSVYGAARQSGGFVWADSAPGRGTTVQVYWPEILAAPEAPPEPERPLPLAGGSETVLVVEDEELVRALALRALRSFGYTCHQVRDAREALRLLEALEPPVDLVLTDVVLPDMSGGEFGDRLAREHPGTPVVYMSAYTDEDVIRRGLLAEGRPFLQKPFTPHQLARTVREALGGAGAAR